MCVKISGRVVCGGSGVRWGRKWCEEGVAWVVTINLPGSSSSSSLCPSATWRR